MTVIAQAAGLSDAGRRRRHNEDAYVCEPPLFAIADGMGGAQAGELASRLAAASVGRAASQRAGTGAIGSWRSSRTRTGASTSARRRTRRPPGMGTTMTVALVEEDVVWLGHVGDSRAYLVRDGKLEQVTEDHSLVAELVRSGRLTAEEADTHPHRSVITRAVGTEPDVEIDTIAVRPRAGDVVPALLGRPHRHGRRRDDPRALVEDEPPRSPARCEGARRRGERGGRRGQHHRPALPARRRGRHGGDRRRAEPARRARHGRGHPARRPSPVCATDASQPVAAGPAAPVDWRSCSPRSRSPSSGSARSACSASRARTSSAPSRTATSPSTRGCRGISGSGSGSTAVSTRARS